MEKVYKFKCEYCGKEIEQQGSKKPPFCYCMDQNNIISMFPDITEMELVEEEE